MSNDQLSWDLLLQTPQGKPPETAPSAASATSPEAASQPPVSAPLPTPSSPTDAQASVTGSAEDPLKVEPKKEKPKSKSRKKASTSDGASSEGELLSKKNWGKLEMSVTSTTVVAKNQTSVTKVEVAQAKIQTQVQTQSQTQSPAQSQVQSQAQSTLKRSATPTPPPNLWPDDDPENFFAGAEEEEEEQKASNEPQIISVSELNKHIRDLLEGRFPLLWLKGEISNFKAHTSGHFYFSLKDAKAQVSAVMFRGFNSQLRFRPEDGMEVIVRGKVTVYEPRGNYQIFCELMEPVGAGALQKAFEQLKAKLQREGLFDEARKRPLPALPRHIAIVTSPTGAAIRDMLNVLGRRFKGVNITVIPCKVQGDQAPSEIVAAIGLANRLADVDVMIVGRGGGSIEDLWAFNDERVARAIAAARVPVISAVGHEVDFTIADFVADLRAPTPSAAAELVVKNAADLTERVAGLARALRLAALRLINSAKQQATSLGKRLVDPQRRLQDASIRCDELQQRLEASLARALQTRRTALPNLETRLRVAARNAVLYKREALKKNMAVLDSLSPLKVLDRGYSMVIAENGDVVTDATSLKDGQSITVRMCKGSIDAQVTRVKDKR